MTRLRLATRGSDLALCQSRKVAGALQAAGAGPIELVIVKTTGDRKLDVALGDAGSIGLFTAEVQQAVLEGSADLAVHSYKDLPAAQVDGLQLAAVPEREAVSDLLLLRPEAREPRGGMLPVREGARVGTSSARRAAFLAGTRGDLQSFLLRGNVPTRVRKLREGEYDAILLAAAGVARLALDLSGLVAVTLPPDRWPGAPGQGAIAVECRADDERALACIEPLHRPEIAVLVDAERELLRMLGGGCGLPLGAHARRHGNGFDMDAVLGPTPDRTGAPALARAAVSSIDANRLPVLALEQLHPALSEKAR